MTGGVMHQIRAHLSFSGHPVAGDWLYGARLNKIPGPEDRKGAGRSSLTGAVPESPDEGFFLHASRLAFPHPITKNLIDLRLDPPPRFTRFRRIFAESMQD
jgi:23S rRNA pseudouridine1911/1915/1917 synthase